MTCSSRVVGELRVRRRAADHRARARPRRISSAAHVATICCARMSSGASRSAISSRLPRRTPRTSAAHSTSWSRVSANSRPFGVRAERVARAADALEQRRDRARRAELDDEIDRADVDAELERRGRDRALDLAVLELLLGGEPQRARHRAVVRDDVLLAEPLLERRRDALDQPPRVDEHDRRAVLRRRARRSDRRPGRTARCDATAPSSSSVISIARSSSRRWPASTMCGSGRRVPTSSRAIRSIGRCVADRPTRTGARPVVWRDQAIEPLERQREVRAALVARDRVDLVDDHRAAAAPSAARPVHGRQQDVQRLRRGDQDVRRVLRHLRALADRRVAGAHRDADLGELHALARGALGELGERRLEVALDVVRQRLERRDVEDRGAVARAARSSPRRTSSSRHARNAASVLPEPVGAAISTSSPARDPRPARRAAARSARRSARGTSRAISGWNASSTSTTSDSYRTGSRRGTRAVPRTGGITPSSRAAAPIARRRGSRTRRLSHALVVAAAAAPGGAADIAGRQRAGVEVQHGELAEVVRP